MQFLPLREHSGKRLIPKADLPYEAAEILGRRFGKQVEVVFPSPLTDHQWQLTPHGWVGYIPLTADFGVALEPKVPVRNLFLMLDYAYKLKGLAFPDGALESESLQDYYESLAKMLAKRVLDRSRKGLYRAYIREADELNCVRGRLDLLEHLRRPWSVALPCQYDEHTADVEENRILAWTLHGLSRAPLRSPDTRRDVRRAYRAVAGNTRLERFSPSDCINRLYNRLNDDYEPLHSLCRFFLEQSGVSHQLGERTMVPFLIYMPGLFELFVAEWLRQNLPSHLELNTQHKFSIDADKGLRFEIDLVIRERDTKRAVCVMDTKYKDTTSPSAADIAQVVAYAESQGCVRAGLIYPIPQPVPLSQDVGRIRVTAFGIDIGDDVEKAAENLLAALRSWLPTTEAVH